MPSSKNSATPDNLDASFAAPQRLMVSKALADVTRCHVLEAIYRAGPLNTGDLSGQFRVSQATISYHLRVLENALLIITSREGKYRMHRRRREALASYAKGLLQL